jgi:hypothetical protein
MNKKTVDYPVKQDCYETNEASPKKDSDLKHLFVMFDKEFSINQELISDIYSKLAPVLNPEYVTCSEEDSSLKEGYITELNQRIDGFVDTLQTQNARLQNLKSRINLY